MNSNQKFDYSNYNYVLCKCGSEDTQYIEDGDGWVGDGELYETYECKNCGRRHRVYIP